MAKYAQIGDKFYTVGDHSQLQQISEQDIIGRRGDVPGGRATLDFIRNEGDLDVVDPSQITITPNGEVMVGDHQLALGGSNAFVTRGTTTEQFTGLPFNQDFAEYLQSTSQTFTPEAGFGGGQGMLGSAATQQGMQQGPQGQVYRDENDNFFLDGRHIELAEFKQLGINADFVQRGTTVALEQARTGRSATGGPSVQPSPSGVPTGGIGASYVDELMKVDPLLADQFSDPALRAKFESWPADLQGVYLQVLRSYKKKIETGNIINPDIEIEPSKIAEFLQQATTEIEPYYQEVLGSYKQDLEVSFARLQEDYNKSVGRAEEPFKQRLAAQAEAEAQAGTTFGSERGWRELRTVQSQRSELDDAATQAARQAQDVAITGERQIGSENLRSLNIPGFSTYQTSSQGFAPAGTRSLFTPQGNLLGAVPKQRTVDINQRQSQLEQDYRRSRILNVSPLGY